MITSKLNVEPYVAEYVIGKYWDPEICAVRFPDTTDIYVTIYDLMARRPGATVDRGNLEIALPDRRDANFAGGKSPEYYNYFSDRASKVISDRLKVMMWAEVHDYMTEQKHMHGIQYKDSVYSFLSRYAIESISEDALIKNYYRWREKSKRRSGGRKSAKMQ